MSIPFISEFDSTYQPGRMVRANYRYGTLPDGSPLFVPFQLICGARPGARLAVVAGVHGDELEGVKATQALMATVTPEQLAGTLLLIPVANVMAFNACARRSPVDQQDLNRLFPGNAAGSVSERLAFHLCHHLLAECALVVSLHGWYQQGALTPWMEFSDIPGPVGQAAHDAARAFGIPDLIPLPLLPGRLISALAQLGIPAIEGEVGGEATFQEANWRIYVAGLWRLLRHLGMTPVDDSPEPSPNSHYWALRVATAPVGGLLHCQVALGDAVQAGERLATIDDLFGQPLAVVKSTYTGKIASIQTTGIAQPGGHLFTILEPTTPAHVQIA